jgi:hypothetical protein
MGIQAEEQSYLRTIKALSSNMKTHQENSIDLHQAISTMIESLLSNTVIQKQGLTPVLHYFTLLVWFVQADLQCLTKMASH